jgi:tRNA (guanine-N7-)-methyltransferase
MEPRRRVRSFVRRAGRVTSAQARALAELWPRFGVETPEGQLDLQALFGRDAPRICEVGFGDGQALAELALRQPGNDFIGIEVHEPGIGHLLLNIERHGLNNVRIIRHDATDVLESWLPTGSLDRVHVFFPDPWPKKRHHKRRLIQPDLIGSLARAIKPGGILHMATDWEPYAEQMRDVADASAQFDNLSGAGCYSEDRADRPETKFERRGLRLGHEVRDLLYRRRAG